MGDGLKHHYAHNRHHPEFFGEDGVDGMSLVDVIEMPASQCDRDAGRLEGCNRAPRRW
jgi:hypothetical protein